MVKDRFGTDRSAVDSSHLLGHEPDAFVRYRVLRHLRPPVLAAYDAGQ